MQFGVLLLFLFVLQWTVGVCQENGVSPMCCVRTSRQKTKTENILSYTIQGNRLCPIKAVRFHLINGKTLCSDPNDPWAIKTMKELDGGKTFIGVTPTNPKKLTTTTTTTITTPVTYTTTERSSTTPKAKSTHAKKNGPQPTCCTTTSTLKVRIENILNYMTQDVPLCPIRAVQFHLINHKVICSDPNDTWARKAKRELDGRKLTTSVTTMMPESYPTPQKAEKSTQQTPVMEEPPSTTDKPPGETTTQSITTSSSTEGTNPATTAPSQTSGRERTDKHPGETTTQSITTSSSTEGTNPVTTAPSQTSGRESEAHGWTEQFCLL